MLTPPQKPGGRPKLTVSIASWLNLKAPTETFRTIQLWVTIVALVLAPFFFGSVDHVWIAVWTVVLSVGAVFGTTLPLGVAQTRTMSAFFFLCFAYAAVAVIQVTPHLFDQLDDPVWQRTNELLQLDVGPRISSRAEITPVAIGRFLLLLTSFVGGFLAGTSRRSSHILILFAQYSILAYSIFGLVALALTPDLLLWTAKRAYLGSFTATFVNHNTAATFVGAGAILWFCSACLSVQSLQSSSLRLLLLTPSNEHVAFKVMLRLAAGLICFFALLLTGSRGGLICTCMGLIVAIGLMITNRLKLKIWYAVGAAALTLAAVTIWLSSTGRIASHGLFDDGRWSVYGFCIEAIRQRPLLGAGAGTFADMFPSLRTPDFNSWGIWDYAHSTILEIAVEMGIPVAAMVVIAAAASVLILARAALRSKDLSRSSLSAIAGIAILSYLHSTIDFSLQIPGYLVVFGILLGCGLARASCDKSALQKVRSRSSFTSEPLSEARLMSSSNAE